jgi:hypothetical protein
MSSILLVVVLVLVLGSSHCPTANRCTLLRRFTLFYALLRPEIFLTKRNDFDQKMERSEFGLLILNHLQKQKWNGRSVLPASNAGRQNPPCPPNRKLKIIE